MKTQPSEANSEGFILGIHFYKHCKRYDTMITAKKSETICIISQEYYICNLYIYCNID